MPSVPTTSLDLTADEVVADPYPFFARERAAHPVAWHEGTQRFLAFGHAAVGAVQRDRRLGRLWTDREPADRLEPFNLLHRNQMMENEPPEHTRLRRPVARAFARGHVERLRPRVRALAASLLAEVDGTGFDVVADYAEPLPVLVIAELLGVPATHVHDLRDWSQAIVRMYEVSPSAAVEAAAIAAASDFGGLVRELAAQRRAHPRADLISDLVTTELNEDEVVAAVVLLLNAGHEASVNVFGNGLVAMLRRGLRPGANAARTVEEMRASTPRCSSSSAPPPRTSRWPGSSSARASGSPRCSARPTATRRSSSAPTSSSWTATPTRTWPSGSACTSAWARRWRAWSWSSR